ncbi:hypothetical protein [Pseudoalteromonas obscura]|nr:hypothetical protein [Pseudoalteromonas sp. P94(2023)]
MAGEADYQTPISEMEQFYQVLKLQNVDTAMVRMPNMILLGIHTYSKS